MANINLQDGNGITFSLSASGNTLTIQIDKRELNSILADLADDSNSEIKKILDSIAALSTRVTAIERAITIDSEFINKQPKPATVDDTLTKNWARAALKGSASDLEDTLYGLKKELIGTSSDATTADTIKGTKNYVDDRLNNAKSDLEGALNEAQSDINDTFDDIEDALKAIKDALDGKAASGHKHSASDITSGKLAIARGGTSADTASDARSALGVTSQWAANAISARNGDYTGSNEANPLINYGTDTPGSKTVGRIYIKYEK